MKKSIFIICLVCMIIPAFATTIHSTSAGGNWNSQSTWVEGIVPGETHDVVINGSVSIGFVVGYNYYGNECNDLLINSSGHIYNIDYGGGFGIFPLTINGNCENNGIIANGSSDALKLIISGDLTNNGSWRPYETNLVSTNNQNLSLALGYNFGSIITRDSSGPLTALTDMVFRCGYSISSTSYTGDFDLNGAIFHLGAHSIDATGTLVYNGTFEGDFEIKGVFTISKYITQTMVFNGTVTVTDTLKANVYGSGYGIFDLKVEGDIINNGVIKNNVSDDLRIKITGDIYNNGQWDHNFTELIGLNDQYLFQSSGKHFEGDFSSTDSTSNIIASSDLNFSNNFDLNGATLDMQFNTLTMQGWLYDGSIDNTLLNGGYLQDLTSLGNLTTDGTVTIYENNNKFIGSTVVNGIIQSHEYASGSITYTLAIDGDITNNGTIQNFNSGDMLILNITGNLTNNGTWDNYRTYLHGESEQHIKIITRGQISSEVIFDANFGTAPFQWYYDDSILDSPDFSGETSNTLTWNIPVPSSWLGTFYCQTNDGPSRNIIVYNSSFEIENISIEMNGASVSINWDAVPLATSYSIYSSTNPNEQTQNWTLEESGITDTTWAETAIGEKKFYYVKALSNIPAELEKIK